MAADLPDLDDMSVWLGLVAPKGTPKPIIDKINAEVVKILADPAVKEKSERTGNYPVTSTPGAVLRLHPQGGRSLVEGDQGNRHQVRLREDRHEPFGSFDRAGVAVGPGDRHCRRARAAGRHFPSRSIKIVVPFPAGGPSDVLARMIGQKMTEDWGQPVVIENRVGANTVIGAQQVAKAAPDGYTLLMAINSTLTMNQYLYRNPPYDPFNDFVPITLTAKSMVFMYVNAASDYKSVKEVIASAKAQPGKLNYGAGTITTPIDGLSVRQGGRDQDGPGQIQWQRPGRAGAPDQERGFHLRRHIGVDAAGAERAIPRLGEIRQSSVSSLAATFRPSRPSCRATRRSRSGSGWSRPRARRRRSSTSCRPRWSRFWPIPPSRQRQTPSGLFPATSTPAEFAAFIRKEAERWSTVVKETGLQYD